MTKGKLYSEVYNKATRMTDKSYECYDAVGLDAVNDVLAEAQKDFPNIDSEKYGSDSQRWKPWNYSAFNRDLLYWFEKWFGDE